MKKLEPFLKTSDRQFGFKKNTGCMQAIHNVKQTSTISLPQDSTVNIAALDITKAFDKINHYKLFLCLMDRFISGNIIKLLANWYLKINTVVKWNNSITISVLLTAGVRQGGILTLILFSVYIDELLTLLNNSKLGCFVRGCCAN